MFGPDDKRVLLWGSRGTDARDFESGRLLYHFNTPVRASSPDGSRVLDKSGTIRDVSTGKPVSTVQPDGYEDCESPTFSPDGRRLLMECTLRSDSMAAGAAPADPVDDGSTVKLWDVATGALEQTLAAHGVHRVAFSPDGGRVLTVGSDRSQLWDVSTGQLLNTLRTRSGVHVVEFGPEGKRVATGTSSGTVKLWNTLTGALERTLGQHVKGLEQLAFSPDGRYLLTAGSADARLWGVETGKSSNPLPGPASDDWSFLPRSGGKMVVAAGEGLSFYRLDAARHVAASITFWSFPTKAGIPVTLVTAPNGLFMGDDAASGKVFYRIGAGAYHSDLVSAEQLFDYFYRPSLVADFWAGRPLTLHPDVASGVGRPPQVEILDVPKGPVEGDSVRVRVRAYSRGGGVKRVRLFCNGARVAQSKSRGLVLKPEAPPGGSGTVGPAYEQVFDVPLEPGRNELLAEGYSAIGLIRSKGAHATITFSAPDTGRPDLYLFAMSLDYYTDSSLTLDGPDKDADAVVDAFKRQQGRLFRHVHVTRVEDSGATLEGVARALGEVARQARRQDVFIMYAAGHGGMTACDDAERNSEYHLLTYRATLLSHRQMCLEALGMGRLTKLLRAIHADKKLLILDTCQSGGAATGATLVAMRGSAAAEAIKRLARAEGLAVLAASKPNQAALETKQLGHGLFTYALLEGLQGAAAPRGENDVSVYSLITYVDRRLPALAREYAGGDQEANYSTQGADFPVFSFKSSDSPLVNGAVAPTAPSAAQPAPAAPVKTTSPPPADVDHQITDYVRNEASLVLACVAQNRAVVVATVTPDGTVDFAVQGVASDTSQGECVRHALTLSVDANSGVTRVPLQSGAP